MKPFQRPNIRNFNCILFCCLCYIQSASGQDIGSNLDLTKSIIGEMPYEMEGRSEKRVPLMDFNDCTQWKVTTENCSVTLNRTREQRVYRPYSGKVTYTTNEKKASFTIELIKPISIKNPWDCINFWNYGDHWLWGEPKWNTAMSLSALIEDASGTRHEISFDQSGYGKINYKYWFLSHLKLEKEFQGETKFVGFKFSGQNTVIGETHTLFLESVYIYKEVLKPLSFNPLPKKMPFPVRPVTILPTNKQKKYTNSVAEDRGNYSFRYKGEDSELEYQLQPVSFLRDIQVVHNGKITRINNNATIKLDTDEAIHWKITGKRLERDTLFIQYIAKGATIDQKFNSWYTINQKSLICSIEEEAKEGMVSEIRLGTIDASEDAKVVQVPFLNFNHGEYPLLVYSNGLFFFDMFDWYSSNASSFYSNKYDITDGQANFNGGVKYIPLTNGKRNPLREKLFINVSPDVQEVFPTIDNPPSPMRSFQADRLWAVNGGTDLKVLGNFVSGLRSKGVEKVSIRYHEGFWRQGGESYTFKLTPNPELGVKKIKEYIAWVKSKDWRVGLYTNYTDLSPVNKHWNEDWVKRGPNGEWEVAWSRTYAPKPQVAYEQEAIFAPKIHKIFDTNHAYCDVHTAVSPMSRVDYDYRVPGAGTFRQVIDCYGLLLMNERKSYQGPVYSEGGNHWWYAGLVDGNYANGYLDRLPIFPDFQLMKIHPLEMDAGNTGETHEYLAYTLAYGNIGLLSDGFDAIKKYAMLQPIQESYVMVPIKSIQYYQQGKAYTSSEAIKMDLLKSPQIHLEYESGFQVFTNFSDNVWKIKNQGRTFRLPKYGILAFHPDSELMSSSVLQTIEGKEQRIDRVSSKDLYYLDTFGQYISDNLGGQGSYMLKKEKFGWEIIPLENAQNIDFDLGLIGLNGFQVGLQGLDENESLLETSKFLTFEGRVSFKPEEQIYKYRIYPIKKKA